jgi:hypothetical protein
MKDRRLLVTAGLGCVDVAALVTLQPDLGVLARHVAAPHAWVSTLGADGAAIALASAGLWCVALWLGVGLLAASAAAVPGGGGRLARALARVLLPAAVHRAVAGAAGLGVLLAPVAAGAVGADPVAGAASSATSRPAPPLPTPAWPSDPPPRPTPGWPTTTSTATPAAGARGDGVVVRPGDSLWGIAAARLGPDSTAAQTAAAWPRWYAANRAVIGADPDLIKPGQRLAPPAQTGSSR